MNFNEEFLEFLNDFVRDKIDFHKLQRLLKFLQIAFKFTSYKIDLKLLSHFYLYPYFNEIDITCKEQAQEYYNFLKTLEESMIKEILEEIRVTKYNFQNRLKEYKGNVVKWNDDLEHDLTQRFFNRLNLNIKSFIDKVKVALDTILKNNFLGTAYCVNFTKSNFKLVIDYKKQFKRFLIVTFLDNNMKCKSKDYKISIDEALKIGLIDEKIYNEAKDSYYVNEDFVITNNQIKLNVIEIDL